MTVPTFKNRIAQWSSPPVDDIGYVPVSELLDMDDDTFRATVEQATQNRYSGWRNHKENWTKHLTRWDTASGQRILDYGCGIGLEALVLSRRNTVFVADISAGNLQVAERAMTLADRDLHGSFLISEHPPFISSPPTDLDVILCLGVLHHIPDPAPVVQQMASWLRPGGELRLMLYTDKAWRVAVGTDPPSGPVEDDEGFARFWQHWDAGGGYADWYDRRRLEERFGEWFTVRDYVFLTVGKEYAGAVLVKR